MTSHSEVFSGEAVRASLLRRLVQMESGIGAPPWSAEDTQIARAVYAWLEGRSDVRVTLPANGIAVDGLPDVEWSAIDVAEVDRLTRGGGPTVTEGESSGGDVGEQLSRADLRVAIRRRLSGNDAAEQWGFARVTADEARALTELYEFISAGADGPTVEVPSHVVFDGRPDVDWNAIGVVDLAKRVRKAYGAPEREEQPVVEASPETRRGGGNVRDDVAGATVHQPSSFAGFIEGRTRRREDEKARLLGERARFRAEADRIREAHFDAAADLFDDTTPRGVRAEALRHHRQSLERDLAEHAHERGEVLGRGRPWYGAMLERWGTERGDRRDYANALKALYDDRAEARRAGAAPTSVGLDPVLVGIPGVRRYRQDGAFVYTRRVDGVDAEMFRVYPETREVVVRSTDLVATEAAIVKAYELDGPPLTFDGSDEFRARCEAIAARHGFEVAASAPDAQRAPAPGGPTAPSTTAPGRPAGATSPAPESGVPVANLDEYGDVVAFVKEQTGVDFVVALDPKHAVAMEPVYLTHTPMKQDGFELVFVQKPGVEAISGVVLPKGTVPPSAVAGETRVDLTIEQGAWKARFDAPQPAQDAPQNDIGRRRGR
jgi:hypothetical protein